MTPHCKPTVLDVHNVSIEYESIQMLITLYLGSYNHINYKDVKTMFQKIVH